MQNRLARVVVAALALSLLAGPALAQTPPAKITVRDETQLPRFAYPMSQAPSALLVADDATFAPFAAAVGADVDRTLRDYDIRDPSSLRDLISTKLALQLLAHDDTGARASIATLRSAESKAELKLLASRRLPLLQLDANAQAKANPGTPAASYLAGLDSHGVNALPWDVVQDEIKRSYGTEQSLTENAVTGFVAHDLDAIAKQTGSLDGPAAHELIQARTALLVSVPLYATDMPVLKAYIAAHNVVKADIWAARD